MRFDRATIFFCLHGPFSRSRACAPYVLQSAVTLLQLLRYVYTHSPPFPAPCSLRLHLSLLLRVVSVSSRTAPFELSQALQALHRSRRYRPICAQAGTFLRTPTHPSYTHLVPNFSSDRNSNNAEQHTSLLHSRARPRLLPITYLLCNTPSCLSCAFMNAQAHATVMSNAKLFSFEDTSKPSCFF